MRVHRSVICLVAILMAIFGGASGVKGGVVSVSSRDGGIIPDADAAGTLFLLEVSGMPNGALITDLDLRLSLEGTEGFNGDYYAYLAKAGVDRLAVLMNRPGVTLEAPLGAIHSGLDRVVFDDEASAGDIHFYDRSPLAPSEIGDPLTGSWSPDGRTVDPSKVTGVGARTALLDRFDGLSPNGIWILFIADLAPGGALELTEWGLDFDVDLPTVQLVGVASDGLIAGGVVFFDANLDGVVNGLEPQTRTGGDGRFDLEIARALFDTNQDGALSADEGVLVLEGGVDIATGLPLERRLRAPPGASVVTPLTDLIIRVKERTPGRSFAEIEILVEGALGLEGSRGAGIALLSEDIFNALAQGDSEALDVLRATSVFEGFLDTLAGLLAASAGQSYVQASEAILDVIAQRILAGESVRLDVPSDIEAIANAVNQAQGMVIAPDALARHQSVLATINREIGRVATGPGSLTDRGARVVAIQGLAQGEVREDFGKLAAAELALEEIEVKYGVGRVESLLNDATAGDLFGDESRSGSFEFDRGAYQIDEAGFAPHAVTIYRRDGNAGRVDLNITARGVTAGSLDVVQTPIALRFEPLEIRKEVPVSAFLKPDAMPEGEETLVLSVALADGAPADARIGNRSIAEVTVVDDESQGVFEFAAASFEVSETGASIAPIVVTRRDGNRGPVSLIVETRPVTGSATPGVDFVPAPVELRFAQNNLNQTVSIPPIDDQVFEGDESLRLVLRVLDATTGATVGSQSEATLVIREDDPNILPKIGNLVDQAVQEDGTLASLVLPVGDAETAAQDLIVRSRSSDPGLVSSQGLNHDFKAGNHLLSITPNPDAFGATTITIEVDDGTDVSQRSFVLTVTPVNDPPFIEPIADRQVAEGVGTFAFGVNLGDIDSPVGSLSLRFETDQPLGFPAERLVAVGDGSRRNVNAFVPSDWFGRVGIQVIVSDGTLSATESFQLVVANVEDPSVVTGFLDVSMDEDTTASVPFSVTDEDTPLEALVLELIPGDSALLPQDGLSIGAVGGGAFVAGISPAENAHGETALTLRVTGNGLAVEHQVMVVVLPVDDPPGILAPSQLEVEIGENPEVDIQLSDVDTPLDALQLQVSFDNPAIVAGDGLSIAGEGGNRVLTIVPLDGVSGETTIVLTADDGVNPPVEVRTLFRVLPKPSLSIEKLDSGRLRVVWNRGTLLSAGSVAGPYVEVSDAVSPLEIEASEDSTFFQIRVP